MHSVRLFALIVLVSAAGCRDEQPPDRLNRNLGDASRPLLPTTLRSYDPKILNGRADIVPLPDLSASEAGADADRAALIDVIEAYAAAHGAGDYEASAAMLVERQRGVAGEVAAALTRRHGALSALTEALSANHPHLLEQAEPTLAAWADVALSADALSFDTETEASIALPMDGGVYRFEKIADGWYVVAPWLEDEAAAVTQRVETEAARLEEALAVLNDAALSDDDRRSRFGAALAALAAGSDADSGGDGG